MSKAYNPKTGRFEVEREQFDDLTEKLLKGQASFASQVAKIGHQQAEPPLYTGKQATNCAVCGSAATVAEPSETWREKLIELADQLDAELTTGVQWSNAQFACFYVSDDLRKIVKKAGGVPNEKDWKTRALEAEKLNRQFMDRWNAENGPTHMGEPVIAAQQQAEPGADERAALSDADLIEVGRTYDIHPDSALSFARDVLARAAQSGQRAGVADGWQLVPVEPTDAMMEAAQAEWMKGCADPTMHVWDAMLAAAQGVQHG